MIWRGLRTSVEAIKIKKSNLRALLIDFKRSQIIRDVENYLGLGLG